MTEPEQRFTALYQLHYEDIARYVRRRAPELDCRDTVAEVFLTAWRRFAELERSPLPLPWLYGVARRVLANAFRGAARAEALIERVAAHAGPARRPTTPSRPRPGWPWPGCSTSCPNPTARRCG